MQTFPRVDTDLHISAEPSPRELTERLQDAAEVVGVLALHVAIAADTLDRNVVAEDQPALRAGLALALTSWREARDAHARALAAWLATQTR